MSKPRWYDSYLEMYEAFEKLGEVQYQNGLCQHFEGWAVKDGYFERIDNPDFKLFIPNYWGDLIDNNLSTTWWGSERPASAQPVDRDECREYFGSDWSDTRKNIVLLLAAMNNEL